RKYPPDRPEASVEREFAEQDRLLERFDRHDVRGVEHRTGETDVVDAADLGQGGRRQSEDDFRIRPFRAGVRHCGSYPVAGFLQGRVGETDQLHAWQSSADVGFDLDDLSVHARYRNGPCASQCHQRTCFRWVTTGAYPRESTTVTTSTRMRVQRVSCSDSQIPASRLSRSAFVGVTASAGVP